MQGDLDKTKTILQKVRQIEIRTKRSLNTGLVGAYHSIFKGQGIDFEELREYIPGDDPRSINWNVSAKMHRPFIKKYKEERELTVFLAVDMSLSNSFGSTVRTKQELAAELASLLAFTADRNQDKVGLLLFTDKIELCLPPKRGRQHILRVIREILFFKPEGKKTNILHAIEQTSRILKHQAVVFLISDFLFETTAPPYEALRKVLSLANKKQEWLPFVLKDSREEILPEAGHFILEDAETQVCLEFNAHDNALRMVYHELKQAEQQQLKRIFTLSGVDSLDLYTHQAYEKCLIQFFKTRALKA